ncbi:MAG TPA: ROK family protein [Candidatus Omnitrophota bacterium]|nr:ROK family protein [Candidatus Omnitrophota bacterium]HPS20522.1 ROK family protein [Candidatus Omnitrophota bacterium]
MRGFLDKEARLSEKERRNLSILDSIRRNGEISRAEISKITDLNIVTVSNYVTKYVKDRLVFETGLDISSGGRRPELLKLNPSFGYSIGIDLGAPHLTIDASAVAVILDVTGKIVAKEKVCKERESFEKLTARILDMTSNLVKKSGISENDIKGIGVGIWGVLDRYRGMVRYAVEEENIVSYTSLLDQIENRFGTQAIIEHDATLAAFGEKWSGVGAISTADNLIFMCSDSSCGMVIRGELYYGASKSAGELNLSPPRTDMESTAKRCWASYDYGCCMRSRGLDLGIPARLKTYLAEHPAEGKIVLDLAGGDINKITFGMAIEAAEKGDDAAKRAVEDAGEYLGAKIAFMINLFNPEVVAVGRGIEAAGDLLFSAVRRSVRRWAYEESVKIVKILPASLGDDSVAVGAAALVMQDFFAKV